MRLIMNSWRWLSTWLHCGPQDLFIIMIIVMITHTLLLLLIIINIALIREGVLATVSPQVKEAVWPATSFIVTSSSGGLNYQVYISNHYYHIQESNQVSPKSSSSSSEAFIIIWSIIHYPPIAAPLPLWHYFPPAWEIPGGGKHFYFYLVDL